MNSKTLFLFAAIFLGLAIAQSNYDYYAFSFEVPAVACMGKNCQTQYEGNLQPQTMNLHGLWPNKYDNNNPESCGENNFVDSDLTDATRALLDERWNGLYSSSFSFRSHEWGKHGTCWNQGSAARRFLSTDDAEKSKINAYFTLGVNLLKGLNIDSVIFAKSVTSSSDLYNRVKSHLGVSHFDLQCVNHSGQQYLLALYICFDLQYNLRDCPESRYKCNANNDVNIPDLFSSRGYLTQ